MLPFCAKEKVSSIKNFFTKFIKNNFTALLCQV